MIENLPKRAYVHGYRGFDSKNGNTYFHIDIYVENKLVFASQDYEYGYESQYLHKAITWLNEHYKTDDYFNYENVDHDVVDLNTWREFLRLHRPVIYHCEWIDFDTSDYVPIGESEE